ncbi:MAG: hypothetical protein II767_03195 [Proteobacteria bacterium]|nr:hypothetical protein [Pseudomonadota bacterium]MBQ4359238.1 hypothetical protein [Pseudomonadota bacterium]
MNEQTGTPGDMSGNAINPETLNAYEQDAGESIEFGDGVGDVVSFDKAEEERKRREAEEAANQPPVRHQKEGTLLVGSEMLKLVEEIDGERKRKHSPHSGLVFAIGLFLGIAIIIGVVLYIKKTDQNNEEAGAEVAAEGDAEVVVKPRDIIRLPVTVTPKYADVLINGVPLSIIDPNSADGLPLVDHYDNQLSFYSEDFVPFGQIVDPHHDVVENPLEYSLVPSDIYLHSTVTIKPPKNADIQKLVYYINGRIVPTKDPLTVDCVSGFPQYIHVRQGGLGDHLEVIWPTRDKEVVELPDLQSAYNAERVTLFNIEVPKDYTEDRSFKMNVFYTDDKYADQSGSIRVDKGELIRISMEKDNRYSLNMILDSMPFGSIRVKSYMQLSSIGASYVKYDRKSEKDIVICFRRASEAVCVDRDGETTVPSGKWELVGYREREGKKVWLDGAPYEKLDSDNAYTFKVSSSGNRLVYEIADKKKKRGH